MEHIKTIPRLKTIELVNLAALFVAFAVALPWFAHQFNLAGPTFLPMHLFVFVGALVLGWRAGVAIGLLTPLISFATSGMPIAAVLPQIIVEMTIYGLVAGYCREKLGWNIYASLLIAMLMGRIGLLLVILILQTNPAGPFVGVWQTVKLGWLGIAIQLAVVPMFAQIITRYLRGTAQENS